MQHELVEYYWTVSVDGQKALWGPHEELVLK